jgi:hypothetical protein
MLRPFVALMLGVILILSMAVFAMASTQQQQRLQQQPLESGVGLTDTAPLTTIYQNNADGFRIGVPKGWVVEDIDNTLPLSQDRERQLGFAILAMLCPERDALRDKNGTYYCQPDPSVALRILRFAELHTRPEFAAVQENSNNRTIITISDFLAFLTQFLEKIGSAKNVQIVDTEETTVNVTDPQTNQTVATGPAEFVFYNVTLTDKSGRDFQVAELDAAILSNDTNTGYFFVPSVSQSPAIGNLSYREIGRLIDQMFNSFELIATTNATTTATAAAPDGRLMMR